MVNPITKVDAKVIPLKKLTPAVRADVTKTVEHHTEVIKERKTIETKIVKGTPPFKPTDPQQIGKLPVIPKHLETPSHVTPPAVPIIPKLVEKVVPKYDPPKPPKANAKPLPKTSLDRHPEELTASAEWNASRRPESRHRPRSAPALM
jgi:hypothetical protein